MTSNFNSNYPSGSHQHSGSNHPSGSNQYGSGSNYPYGSQHSGSNYTLASQHDTLYPENQYDGHPSGPSDSRYSESQRGGYSSGSYYGSGSNHPYGKSNATPGSGFQATRVKHSVFGSEPDIEPQRKHEAWNSYFLRMRNNGGQWPDIWPYESDSAYIARMKTVGLFHTPVTASVSASASSGSWVSGSHYQHQWNEPTSATSYVGTSSYHDGASNLSDGWKQ